MQRTFQRRWGVQLFDPACQEGFENLQRGHSIAPVRHKRSRHLSRQQRLESVVVHLKMQCRCGSTTHRRVSSAECPLNKDAGKLATSPTPLQARRPTPDRAAAPAWAVLWMTGQLLKANLTPVAGAAGRLCSVVHVCHNARISLDWLFVNVVRNFACRQQRTALGRLEAWCDLERTLPLPAELIARIKGFVWPTVTIRCAREQTVGEVARLVELATGAPENSRVLVLADRTLNSSSVVGSHAHGMSSVHFEVRHRGAAKRKECDGRVYVDVVFDFARRITWHCANGMLASATPGDIQRVADGYIQPLRFSNKVCSRLAAEPRQFFVDIGRSGDEKGYRRAIVRQVARFEWGGGPDRDPVPTPSSAVRRIAFLEVDRKARAALSLPGPVSLHAPCGLVIRPVGGTHFGHLRIDGSVTAGELVTTFEHLGGRSLRMWIDTKRDQQMVRLQVPSGASMARVFLGAGARGFTGTPACEPLTQGHIFMGATGRAPTRLDLLNIGGRPQRSIDITNRHRLKYVYC